MFVKFMRGAHTTVHECHTVHYHPKTIEQDPDQTQGVFVMEMDGDKGSIEVEVDSKQQGLRVFLMNDKGVTVDTLWAC